MSIADVIDKVADAVVDVLDGRIAVGAAPGTRVDSAQ